MELFYIDESEVLNMFLTDSQSFQTATKIYYNLALKHTEFTLKIRL